MPLSHTPWYRPQERHGINIYNSQRRGFDAVALGVFENINALWLHDKKHVWYAVYRMGTLWWTALTDASFAVYRWKIVSAMILVL